MEINWSICTEQFGQRVRIPLVLPCGHTYCQVCLRNMTDLRWPEDRTPFTSQLPKNFMLLQLIPAREEEDPPAYPPVQPQTRITRVSVQDLYVQPVLSVDQGDGPRMNPQWSQLYSAAPTYTIPSSASSPTQTIQQSDIVQPTYRVQSGNSAAPIYRIPSNARSPTQTVSQSTVIQPTYSIPSSNNVQPTYTVHTRQTVQHPRTPILTGRSQQGTRFSRANDIRRNDLTGLQLNISDTADFSGQKVNAMFDDIIYPVAQNQYLKKLKLANCQLSEDNLIILFEVLKENTTLEVLNISKNKIPEQAIAALYELVSTNTTL